MLDVSNQMRTHKQIRKRLIYSALTPFDFEEWREACIEARDAGWTSGQVEAIMWLCSPLVVLMVYIPIILILIGIIISIFK